MGINIFFPPAPVAGQIVVDPASALTPGRTTVMDADCTEQVLVAGAWGTSRFGAEVAKPSVAQAGDPSNYAGCMYVEHASAWILKPVQSQISDFQEYPALATSGSILNLFNLNCDLHDPTIPQSGLAMENKFHPNTDLGGVNMTAQAAGDPFIVKKVADNNWDIHQANGSQFNNSNIESDTVAISNTTFRANQAFYIRWSIDGISQYCPDDIWRFYFGQYCLLFNGGGTARLMEMISQSGTWIVRHAFRFCDPAQLCGIGHSIAIWPGQDRNGNRFIVFTDSKNEAASVVGTLQSLGAPGGTRFESIYQLDTGIRGGDPDQSPGYASASSTIAIDMRRDFRVDFQVSTLAFPTTGTLIDLPAMLPDTTGNAIGYRIYGYYPNGTNITIQVNDADTNTTFNPAGNYKPYATFTLTGDGTDTPLFYGYELYRAPFVQTIAPGQFTCNDIRSVNLESYDGRPESQKGTVVVSDVTGIYTRFYNRGQLSNRLYVNEVVASVTNKIVLNRGRIVRPSTRRKGKPSNPNNKWLEYTTPMLGMWQRLYIRVERTMMRRYGDDGTTLNGAPQTWKVTDAIVDLLQAAGFPDAQINILPDTMRLWPGESGLKSDDLFIKPESHYGDVIVRFAQTYLGAYIYYNENYGTDGAWQLLRPPPTIMGTPVATFTTATPGPYIPGSMLGAYGPNVFPVLSDIPESTLVPPAYNLLLVGTGFSLTGTDVKVSMWRAIHNPISLYSPGDDAMDMTDVNHPDYLGGECRPLIVAIPALGANLAGSPDLTRYAVDWTAIRLYNFTCHGQRIFRFRSILAFITDTTLSNAVGNRRPLRFQDLVSYVNNGTAVPCIVKSMSVAYTQDNMQMADYELIDVSPNQL